MTYKCPVCERTFESFHGLQVHMRMKKHDLPPAELIDSTQEAKISSSLEVLFTLLAINSSIRDFETCQLLMTVIEEIKRSQVDILRALKEPSHDRT